MIYKNIDKESRTYQAWYPTLSELITDADNAPAANLRLIDSLEGTRLIRQKHGVFSVQELQSLMRQGWSEGVQVAQSLSLNLLAPRLKNIKRVKRRADFGDAIDMQAVYGGSLDRAWETTRRETRSSATGNSITLAVELTCDWWHDADSLHWTGAAAIKLVDVLVTSGRNVQVIGYLKTTGSYRNPEVKSAEICFVAKEYEDPADLSKLMTILGHAGFFRYYGFKAFCAAPELTVVGDLGQSSHNMLPKLIESREPPGSVIHLSRVFSQPEAQELINKTIMKLGGENP